MKFVCRDCSYILKKEDKKNICPICSSYHVMIEGNNEIHDNKETKPKTSFITFILTLIVLGFACNYFIEMGYFFIDDEPVIRITHGRISSLHEGDTALAMGYFFIGFGIVIGGAALIVIKRFISKERF